MSKIKEVLRLKYLNLLSNRQIQTISGVSRNSVANYVNSFNEMNLSLEKILELNDEEIEQFFHPKKPSCLKTSPSSIEIDWNNIHQELCKKGMTRKLLYEEISVSNPNICSYSQFNRNYNKFVKTINPSMRQIHYAGDKLFIDYSGLTMPIVNQRTGEINKAQIFVTVLGASGYTYVHASMSQSTKDFINSHVNAFYFYGGVPNILVPDNLKAAVISNKKGIVKLNDAYADMARHYGIAIEPARPYKPQDKSKVELGVKAIQRWILMRLRHHTFFGVDQLNEEINKLLDLYNEKKVRRFNKSRTELFELLDKPYLHPLRANRYIYKEFKKATVGIDYHIELLGNGYSVPYIYLGKKVDVTYSSTSVVISLDGNVIAHHKRLFQPYTDSTQIEHMPVQHQYQYEKWNSRRILHWANSLGVFTTALMQKIMDSKGHEVRAYKSCIAILSFSKTYGKEEIEMVSKVALQLDILKVSSIESMLKTKSYLYYYTQQTSVNNPCLNSHENIRGGAYYAKNDI
ncbi:MAG: IS21 family transposase [Arcobacteraceae bacterium]|nr:IS21 family transposase [Arcobacteraceae bacterium]